MVEIHKAKPCDHIRFIISALILLFTIIVTSYAIVMQKTSFFKAVPGYAALILFIVDLFLLAIVEGLQIALVELKRQHPDSYKNTHPAAHHLGQVSSRGDNVERFLMGRQVCVVILVFFAAKLTTIHADDADGNDFLFPVPKWFQASFLETGFLSCVVVVILAQLLPQIVAAKYPVHFLQFAIMKPAYYFCIFLEMTGLTHICWVLAWLMEKAAKMSDDETTKNPLEEDEPTVDVLKKVHSNLDNVNIDITGEDEENNLTEKNHNVLIGKEEARFDQMVATIQKKTDPDTLRLLRHYLDSHPEKFAQFPTVIGDKLYPAPQAIATHLKQNDLEVPRFLKDISDPEHIPPHIVACELLVKVRKMDDEITLLQHKLGKK